MLNFKNLGLCKKCGAEMHSWQEKEESDYDFEMFPKYTTHYSHDGDCQFNQLLLSKTLWVRVGEWLAIGSADEFAVRYSEKGRWFKLKDYDKISYANAVTWDIMQDEFEAYSNEYYKTHTITKEESNADGS